MSTLSSASTIEEVYDAYDDNASWEEDSDVAKARAILTPIRILLGRPTEASELGRTRKYDPAALRAEASDARRFIARSSGRRVRYFAPGRYR